MRRDIDPDPSLPRRLCSVCGQPLDGDQDDESGHPGGPMCGSCVRAREFDQTMWELGSRGEDAW